MTQHGRDARKIRAAVRRARVVFTTCAGAGAGALQGCEFLIVIIDEGAQVLPPCTTSSTSKVCSMDSATTTE